MNDELWSLDKLPQEVKLFPLPNLVLFPHVVQPLHVFEPRYRQLTTDALAGDRLIAMVLTQPDNELDRQGQPRLCPVACLGQIVAYNELPDERSILLLRGVSRLRIIEELPSDRMYRIARVEAIPDVAVLTMDESRGIRRNLADLIMARFQGSESDKKQLQELFESEMPLGGMCDVLSYQVPLEPAQKQKLLEENDVAIRARELIRALESITPPRRVPRKYPVEFSVN